MGVSHSPTIPCLPGKGLPTIPETAYNQDRSFNQFASAIEVANAVRHRLIPIPRATRSGVRAGIARGNSGGFFRLQVAMPKTIWNTIRVSGSD